MIEWIGVVLIVVSIILDFVAINRIGKTEYKDAKAALYAGAILAIIGLIVIATGVIMSSSASEVSKTLKDNPELVAALA